jgi:hypothetical protein
VLTGPAMKVAVRLQAIRSGWSHVAAGATDRLYGESDRTDTRGASEFDLAGSLSTSLHETFWLVALGCGLVRCRIASRCRRTVLGWWSHCCLHNGGTTEVTNEVLVA